MKASIRVTPMGFYKGSCKSFFNGCFERFLKGYDIRCYRGSFQASCNSAVSIKRNSPTSQTPNLKPLDRAISGTIIKARIIILKETVIEAPITPWLEVGVSSLKAIR